MGEFSADLKDFLNELLDPQADQRIGARGAGFEELRLHPWLVGIDMESMLSAEHKVPYHAATFTASKAKEIKKAGAGGLFNEPAYTGPPDWFSDWASFTGCKSSK